jgi:hypothetical protein
LPESIKLVLITNGSLIHRENVQQGLKIMAGLNGEVWFKLDRASEKGMSLINDTRTSLDKVRENLTTAISCCPNTWLQTCWFTLDGEPPGKQDEVDYINFLKELLQLDIRPKGVLLYGIARPSMQPEATRLQALSKEQIEHFAKQIRQLDLDVKIAE